MARRNALAALLALLALTPAPRGHAQPRELTIAVYAPWAGPTTADERFAFARQIEGALTEAGLGPARVSSYAKARDFKRALAADKPDLVLTDAAATALLPKRLAVVASWSSGERWVLAGPTELDSLRNKRLALQAADATTSARLVERLLRGQAPADYWSGTVGAPVTEDARQLVERDLADVVVIPQRLVGRLVELASLDAFSELSLAAAGAEPRVERAADVIRAAVRASLGGRWSDGAPSFPAPVGISRLSAARAPTAGPSLLDLLAPAESAVPELPLDEMWMDPNGR